LLLICALCAAPAVHATFTLDPALVVFKADRGERTAFIELVHTGGGPAAVQLTMFERKLDMDGALIAKDLVKTPDFIVHPSEVILTQGARATVQIQYRGKGKITEDRAYMLYSQEVPIELATDGEETGITVNMLTEYYTVVALETGKAGKMVFVSSKALGGGRVEVIAENRGAGRIPVERISLKVGGGYIREFTGKKNSIMPGQRRRFTFDCPRELTERDVIFGR
jgi:P pilus assembly chaperone PapD